MRDDIRRKRTKRCSSVCGRFFFLSFISSLSSFCRFFVEVRAMINGLVQKKKKIISRVMTSVVKVKNKKKRDGGGSVWKRKICSGSRILADVP